LEILMGKSAKAGTATTDPPSLSLRTPPPYPSKFTMAGWQATSTAQPLIAVGAMGAAVATLLETPMSATTLSTSAHVVVAAVLNLETPAPLILNVFHF
jgi:hypothetical protein